jgi:hypothetical protein
MSDEKRYSRRSTGGGGGGGLITITWIILLILRLTVRKDMKWYWVFSPIWISAGLAILFLLFIGFILLLVVIGLISSSAAWVVGIQNWFKREEQKEIIIDAESTDTDTG